MVPLRVSLVGSAGPLADHLQRAGCSVTDELDGDVVVVLGLDRLGEDLEDVLLALSVPVLLVGPTMSTALSDAAGLVPGALTPLHEIRVRPGPDAGELAHRLGGAVLLTDHWPLQDKVADDVEVLLTASSAYADHPVATWRVGTGVGTLTVGSTASTCEDPAWLRLVHRLVRRLGGLCDGPPVRVGLLGYGAITSETRLSLPAPPPQPFHRELADAVLSGAPMSVTPADSRRSVAVMQAATQSAVGGGRPVPLPA